MPYEPEVTIACEMTCSECGDDLRATCKIDMRAPLNVNLFSIEPCKTCMETARDEGYDTGKEEAEAGLDTEGE